MSNIIITKIGSKESAKIARSRSASNGVKKLRLGICILAVGLTVASWAHASLVIFKPNVIGVQVGKTFTLPVVIDPAGKQQYTVRLSITFPPDLLEVTSFVFDQNWIAVPQPRYDLLDNKRGELIKTAGFPKGFSSPVPFGTITFRAKASGDSAITIGSQTFVLNAQSKSTLESRPQVRVIAAEGLAPKASSITPLPNLPLGEKNIFDVNLVPQVQTTGAGLISKVAPGEFLPLSVKLLNFGNRNKVDVTITYKITDVEGKVIYSAEETVAVETTATFVKTIQIPFETTPGRYIAKSSIVYQDQVAPATTEFPFTVERKILGIFQSEFIIYGSIILILSILISLIAHAFAKRRRLTRSTPFDYSDIPHDERVFFELLSDTIMEMRGRVGDQALEVARKIDGLVIDIKTGRVLKLTGKPSKIIAELVSGYEHVLDKKVSFSFRREKTDSTHSTSSGQAGSP